MAQTLVNIRMDEEIKKMPSEASVDPFYSESNMAYLCRGVEALNSGKGVEHDIIEVYEGKRYGLMEH